MCNFLLYHLTFYSTASNGEIGILKYLISKGCKVDVPTKLGRSPLSKACWNGRIDVVDILIQQKDIDINRQDVGKRSALHNACWGSAGGRLGKKTALNPTDSPQCAAVKQFGLYIIHIDTIGSWGKS